MQVTINVPGLIVTAAEKHGKPLAEYIEEFLTTHAEQFAEHVTPSAVASAMDRIHQLRKGLAEK